MESGLNSVPSFQRVIVQRERSHFTGSGPGKHFLSWVVEVTASVVSLGDSMSL